MCIHTPPKPLLLLFLSSSACRAHIIGIYLRPSRLNDDGTCGRKSNDIIRILSNKVIKPPERDTLYQMPGSAEKADSRTCGVGTKVNMCMLYTCTIYVLLYAMRLLLTHTAWSLHPSGFNTVYTQDTYYNMLDSLEIQSVKG